jgi:RNA polymerase sigma-70 factor (ECF subfamily)
MEPDERPDPAVESLRTAGPERAARLGELFEAHRQRLLRMVDLRMSPELKARVGASDVLQEAWVEVSSRIQDYLDAPRMPFFLWVRFITAQRLMKLHRFHVGAQKRDVRRQAPARVADFPGATSVAMVERLEGREPSASGVLAIDELRRTLLTALDGMDPLDREVLALRHFEELSNTETAEELGISKDAASKRYVRALERLRKILGRSDPA